MPRKQRLQTDIRRLRKEIQEIESTIYGPTGDLYDQRFLLQLKRNHAIRGVVLELHLAIEDLLNGWLKSHFLAVSPRLLHGSSRNKSKIARTVDELLEGGGALGFEKKLNLLRAIGLIRKSVYDKLVELNRVRNKCSHNWELDAVIRKKAKKRVPKRRLLEYRGRNLFDIAVLKDFASEYGSMYYRLFMKVYA